LQGLHRRPQIVLADAGYWSEANVVALQARGIEPLIATGADTQRAGAGRRRAVPPARRPVLQGVMAGSWRRCEATPSYAGAKRW